MRLLPTLTLLCLYGGSAWGDKGKESAQVQQLCYVCRKNTEPFLEDAELSRQFPNDDLPACGRDTAAKKVCPPQYSKGCYTETKGGKVVTKMCSGVEISDCQEANDVNYCYCKGQLCNKEGTAGRKPTTTVGPETDDEDLSGEEGGSGDGKHHHHHPPAAPSSTTSQRPPTAGGGGGHPHAVASSSRHRIAALPVAALFAFSLLLL